MNIDDKYMHLALKLAARGIASVEPNPAVGAVIVKENQIIGKGYHKQFGGPHAEINALEDCRIHGADPRGATMYVTLEPCCHHGKTPPCTDAIIAAGLTKVVAAAIDPSPHNNGAGVRQLRTAGIEVRTGLCEIEARLLNAPFFKFAAIGRCWTILKWAQSIDGKLAYTGKTAGDTWISNEQSRKDAHKLRRRVQAILVGINTVLADDPLLTPRPPKGKNPTRIVLDSRLRIPLDCQLLDTAEETPVLIAADKHAVHANPQKAADITAKAAEVLTCPCTQGQLDLHFLLAELSKRRITQLLVEGGPTVLTSFLTAQLADEICIYITPKILGPRGAADISQPMAQLSKAIDLHHVDIKRCGNNLRVTGFSKKALDEISVPYE
jgi:diaminohydroxyphosphoribosylaminopyrimidine deaminase/5-amino-6-(5-phosphoribosylamino)uracil reductase